MDHKEILISLLGLPADSADEAIANAAKTFQSDMVAFKNESDETVASLTNRAETAEAAATTIANEAKAMAQELVEYDLEKYKDAISNTEDMKKQLLENRASTIAILKNVKLTNTAPKPAPLHDPKTAGQPAPVITNAPEVKAEMAKRISNRARELVNTLHVSHQQAWNMAQGEVAKEETK
jgi:hypothetical protein